VSRRHSIRAIYLTLGITMLILGFVGMLLPIMPTTIFLIVAAWFFGRSSPRLEAWLLNHHVSVSHYGTGVTRARYQAGSKQSPSLGC
jgi:uncharacterized membrane protein YbaN (DUF454 family)